MTRQTRDSESDGTVEGAGYDAKQGRRVEAAPGVMAFAHIDFTVRLYNDYDVGGRLVLDDPPSRYLLDSFTVRRQLTYDDIPGMPADARRKRDAWVAAHARPVTAEGIRSVAVERVVSQVLRFYGVESTVDDLDDEQVAELRIAGVRDEAALRFVAAAYLTASLRGDPPAAWVAHWLDCSQATAARWVAAAKDAGYLRVADTRRR